MLVLSRKVGEEVVIGDGIRIKVVALQGNKVRLGFEAPDNVAIRREKICFDAPKRGPAMTFSTSVRKRAMFAVRKILHRTDFSAQSAHALQRSDP